jgi:DNA-binding NtrC family response regulator
MKKEILIVEDDLVVANDIRRTLEKAQYRIAGIAPSGQQALELIKKSRPQLVLLDIYLEGEMTGIDLAVKLKEINIAFVYLSANSNQQILEEVKVTSPDGFIVKPFREKDLLVSVDIALYRVAQHQLAAESEPSSTDSNRESRPDPAPIDKSDANFEGIIGNSLRMKTVFHLIKKVAPMNTSVLITGESGTGKEGAAAAIHKLSGRKKAPFIKINCAAMPAHLIESELFGHEKGAFTGAYDKKIGKFEQAQGGTILLDEIGEMPPDLQVKLLRVLQEREIERVGGKQTIKVDVRIIAATNRNIEKEIATGKFRLDLYYRLLVFPINMPSLRDRIGDVELLANWFMKEYARKSNKHITSIAPGAMQQLLTHSWPGNVRELENCIERAVVLADAATITEISIATGIGNDVSHILPAKKTMQEMENEHILDMLKRCDNKIAGPGGAAEALDLPPSTLYSKMKKLGIVRKYS